MGPRETGLRLHLPRGGARRGGARVPSHVHAEAATIPLTLTHPFSKPRANPNVFTLKGTQTHGSCWFTVTEFGVCKLKTIPGWAAASRMPVLGAASTSDGRFYRCVTTIKETNPHTQSIQTKPILIVCAAHLDGLQNLTSFIRAPPLPAWAPHTAPRGTLLHLCSQPTDTILLRIPRGFCSWRIYYLET